MPRRRTQASEKAKKDGARSGAQSAACLKGVVVVLNQVGTTLHGLCSLLRVSRTWRSAITQSCSGCVDIELRRVDTERFNLLGAWLASYGHLSRSLRLGCDEAQSFHKPSNQIALALGLRLASLSKAGLRSLRSLTTEFRCTPAVLRELPSRSLTRLDMYWGGPAAPILDPLAMNTMAGALGGLVGLRVLHLGDTKCTPCQEAIQPQYVAALGGLTCLTELKIGGLLPDHLSYLQQLPASLEVLTLSQGTSCAADPRDWMDLSQLDLSHLTRVTWMACNMPIRDTSRLPSNVLDMEAYDEGGTMDAIARLSHLQSLSIEGHHAESRIYHLTSLTSLTELDLTVKGVEYLLASVPFWHELDSLETVEVDRGFDNETLLDAFFALDCLRHLAAATSLISFELDGDELSMSDLEEPLMAGFCNTLAKLPQLERLSLSSLPLFGGAMALTKLTQLTCLELSYCDLPDRVVVALGCALRDLEDLDLRGNSLGDICTPALGLLTALTSLDLSGCEELTAEGLGHLTPLRRLLRLEVQDVPGVPDIELDQLLVALGW